MPENGREDALGVCSGEGEFVGMTDACCLHLNQHLALARPLQTDFHNLQGSAGCNGYGGAGFHSGLLQAFSSLSSGAARFQEMSLRSSPAKRRGVAEKHEAMSAAHIHSLSRNGEAHKKEEIRGTQ